MKKLSRRQSQGETLAELECNIEDAYQVVLAASPMDPAPASAKAKAVTLEVA